MSTQKGGDRRKREQKYKNETAFKNNKYDSNSKGKLLNQLKVSNVCQRCKEIIEWKIKYDKYKALTAPKKCVRCSQKKVKYAYHIACTECALKEKACAKCMTNHDVVAMPEPDSVQRQKDETRLREGLKAMPLREQKTFWRQVERERRSAEEGSATNRIASLSSDGQAGVSASVGDNEDNADSDDDESNCDSHDDTDN
ncbi:uncharacterized protein C9orf85 homolog [Rhopilema esculentum]|uniref:uncharacterized protein C9orf85 homolog n=1 Tax=Rhopilema esculentum TaxID=499914 RepID=UPI0031D69A61|eukprot:gene6446-11891_t